MIRIVTERRGLDFEQWLDALQQCDDNAVIGDPRLDDFPAEDLVYLALQFWFRNRQPVVDDLRALGNQNNPQYCIVDKSLQCRLRKKGGVFWKEDPKYRRIRPFHQRRNFIYMLLNREENWTKLNKYYFTTLEKDNFEDDSGLFKTEINFVKPQNILCLDDDTYEKVCSLIEGPKITKIVMGRDWRKFYQTTREYFGFKEDLF